MAKILKLLLIGFGLFHSIIAIANQKILNIPLHAAKISLDPTGIQDLSSLFVSRQVNCQLVREQGAMYTLEAAESIKYASPFEVVIKINQKAKFHDGSPITAEDVVASFNHIKASRNTLRNIFDWIKQIKAQDKNTVIFNLTKPIPQFLKVLSAPNYAIFKKSFLNNAKQNNRLWEKPLGCGKYKISETSDQLIRLTPIQNGYPITFFLSKANQLTPDEIRKFDITDLKVNGNVSEIKDYISVETFDPTQIFIGLNTNKSSWKNKSDRCRFLAKLNPETILKDYGSDAREANDYFPQGILGYDRNTQYMTSINNIYRSQAMPKRESFCLTFLTLSVPEKYRSAYLNAIKKIIPHVTTKELTQVKQFGPDFNRGSCDALIMGLKSNYLDGYEYLVVLSERNANYTGYVDKKLAQEIKDSQNIIEPSVRASKYREIVSKIENLCLIRPLISIPMRTIYIKKSLQTPGIGVGPLNEYDLSNIQ